VGEVMNTIIFLNNIDCIADCGGADILRVIKFVFILLDIVLFVVLDVRMVIRVKQCCIPEVIRPSQLVVRKPIP